MEHPCKNLNCKKSCNVKDNKYCPILWDCNSKYLYSKILEIVIYLKEDLEIITHDSIKKVLVVKGFRSSLENCIYRFLKTITEKKRDKNLKFVYIYLYSDLELKDMLKRSNEIEIKKPFRHKDFAWEANKLWEEVGWDYQNEIDDY